MSTSLSIDKRLRRRVLPLLLSVITLLMALALAYSIHGIRRHNLELATEGARNIFRMIVLTRQWNAEHGGVYVFASDTTRVNQYLDHPRRVIDLPDKRQLVLVNPAYMTRQIAELAASDPQLRLRLHITSLKPIRPENSPDSWEAEALKQFDQGLREMAGIVEEAGQNQLRYMAPLMVRETCLQCHAKQGYKLGDVRGGISVGLQMQDIEKAMHHEILSSVVSHGMAYGLLVIVSWGLIELLARRWRALDDNIEILQNTRDELVETEKMASLGRLVAGFAHELNTPVGVAVGAVSHGDGIIGQFKTLLARDEVTEQELMRQLDDLLECHQLALANLRRAADLVQRFKRTSIDRDSQQQREFPLAELIQDVLFSLQNTLKHTAIEIRVECPENLKIHGTPGLLEQVLTNLITNSLCHGFDNGRRSGEIGIQASLIGQGRLAIDYRDNGVGMSEQVRQQAFEPFFTTSRDQGGSGLGLYVIYNIITKQMHGAIQIWSAPGAGVRFHIECPIELSLN
ncbi:DUF3365 domain-containing protein [Methylomonas sp. LL1]|uniref:ATP-binding protein n=1 Tax=Methylomonas sp. LL1 TaxID=2785785 RepID=UPI0018C3EC23|nr:DUF3365 domain-containing protein [Methylomonas sp. LL1]QPK63324.1 DUF3365 domain-containing protein [Methylomonas sp. LL1]